MEKYDSQIISKSYLLAPVHLQRGLRQGTLFLLLCVIQGEIAIYINQGENIKGIKISNKMKISEYADNSNFFLTKQKSVENVLNYFQNLHKATGATINLGKTTTLVINSHQHLTYKTSAKYLS